MDKHNRFADIMVLPEMQQAWQKHFEECCTDGGFDMETFLEQMMEWVEDWLRREEETQEFKERLEADAQDQYNEICEKYAQMQY